MGRRDAETGQRKTKRDKARRNFELSGKHSARHLRIVEEQERRRALRRAANNANANKNNKAKNNNNKNHTNTNIPAANSDPECWFNPYW